MATHIPKNKISSLTSWSGDISEQLHFCGFADCSFVWGLVIDPCLCGIPDLTSGWSVGPYIIICFFTYITNLTSSPTTLPFLHTAQDKLTYLLLLEYSRNTPASRPLYLLFPLIGTFFPQIFIGSLPLLQASPQMSHSW